MKSAPWLCFVVLLSVTSVLGASSSSSSSLTTEHHVSGSAPHRHRALLTDPTASASSTTDTSQATDQSHEIIQGNPKGQNPPLEVPPQLQTFQPNINVGRQNPPLPNQQEGRLPPPIPQTSDQGIGLTPTISDSMNKNGTTSTIETDMHTTNCQNHPETPGCTDFCATHNCTHPAINVVVVPTPIVVPKPVVVITPAPPVPTISLCTGVILQTCCNAKDYCPWNWMFYPPYPPPKTCTVHVETIKVLQLCQYPVLVWKDESNFVCKCPTTPQPCSACTTCFTTTVSSSSTVVAGK